LNDHSSETGKGPEKGTGKEDATPWTILQSAPIGAFNKRDGGHPVDNPHLVLPDLDVLDQRPDHFPACRPVRLPQSTRNALGKLLQLADDQAKFRAPCLGIGLRLRFRCQPRQPLPRRTQPRLELLFLQQPLAVAVDQPAERLLRARDPLGQRRPPCRAGVGGLIA
jgi:hypothetical protein